MPRLKKFRYFFYILFLYRNYNRLKFSFPLLPLLGHGIYSIGGLCNLSNNYTIISYFFIELGIAIMSIASCRAFFEGSDLRLMGAPDSHPGSNGVIK